MAAGEKPQVCQEVTGNFPIKIGPKLINPMKSRYTTPQICYLISPNDKAKML